MKALVYMIFPASVLIAVTALLRALLLDRLPKRLFTALWLVAAVRLLVPFSLILPSVPNTPNTAMWIMDAAEHVRYRLANAAGLTTAPGPVQTRIFLSVRAVVAAALAGYFILSHIRFLRRCRLALPAESPAIPAIAERFRLRRRVRILVSRRVSSPLTYGVLRPVILLPEGMARGEDEMLRCALVHEFVHIRRFHVPFKYLLAAVLCLYWFDPLVWLMYALAARDIELVCDREALRLLGGCRADYAMTLIKLEEERGVGVLLTGLGGRAVKERVRQIMLAKKRGIAPAVPAVILLLCSAVSFLSTTQTPIPASFDGGRAEAGGLAVYVASNQTVTPLPVPALAMRAEPEGDL